MSRVSDKSISLLLQQFMDCTGHWLIVADENWQASDWLTAGSHDQRTSTAISNRLEIARGALLARCRVARSVAMDVTCDFHGEAAGTWLGAADARERDGLVAIQRALDADARGID